MQRRLRIGTRGSPLALVQANAIARQLQQLQGGTMPELVLFSTLGDRQQHGRPAEFGGKGVFTREPEEALRQGIVDIAVHSLKDMAAEDPADLMIAAVPLREDVRDKWFCNQPHIQHPQQLPAGSVVGTASLRRRAQLLQSNPLLQVQLLRGNVATRLQKMHDGECAATLLASAGLNRLGITDGIPLPTQTWVPAACQGALGVQISTQAEDGVQHWVSQLNHAPSAQAVAVERAFLSGLGASCRMPVSAYARIEGDSIHFIGQIFTVHGTQCHTSEWVQPAAHAVAYAHAQGVALLSLTDASFFA